MRFKNPTHVPQAKAGAIGRREFGRMMLAAGALGLVERHTLARALGTPRQVSRLAARTASAEGAWRLSRVDGTIPKELAGTLYRICPGQRENHGVALRHLFDGDAFVAAYRFRDGRADLRARFVDTPQRVEELAAKRMLYDEFGTQAPPRPAGWTPKRGKNQPSVNVVAWDGRLLGLSEGGHPTAIDPETLAYGGEWDFRGTLPPDVPFTAHPRFDPETGVGYGYGVRQGPGTALTVYRMEIDGKLTQLFALPQSGYFIVHDMLLTREHIVFLVPPARFDFAMLFSGTAKVAAEAVKFFEKEPMRVLVMRRDGTGEPVSIEQPPGMLFHHGNAHTRDGKIVLETILSPDGAALEAVYSFAKGDAPAGAPQQLLRLEIDPAKRAVTSRTSLDDAPLEFPRYDLRRTGSHARFLYTAAFTRKEDPFGADAVVRHDLARGATARAEAGDGRVVSEPVFVPRPGSRDEERGWLLTQGFDASRDENFVEIRDAATLDFIARVWAGIHFPLGFHGNFTAT